MEQHHDASPPPQKRQTLLPSRKFSALNNPINTTCVQQKRLGHVVGRGPVHGPPSAPDLKWIELWRPPLWTAAACRASGSNTGHGDGPAPPNSSPGHGDSPSSERPVAAAQRRAVPMGQPAWLVPIPPAVPLAPPSGWLLNSWRSFELPGASPSTGGVFGTSECPRDSRWPPVFQSK